MTDIHHTTSADGTEIGYVSLGAGPGLIVLHGSMQSAYSQLELARALAGDLTVHLVERRGRGISGPYGKQHGMRQELDDLHAVMTATGATDVFGISSGAVITLHAMLTLPIRRACLFEPPLFPDGDPPAELVARAAREMAAGRTKAALVSGMKASEMGPPIFNSVPRFVLEWLTGLMLDRASAPELTMRELAPTSVKDMELIVAAGWDPQALAGIANEVLLLSGSATRPYLKAAQDGLQSVLPKAERVELPGLHHGATGNNRAQGGRPEVVAEAVRAFFTR